MTKQQIPARRGRVAFCMLAACALFVLALSAATAHTTAQSGRKGAKPAATPTPEATPQAESESESRPHSTKPTDAIVSFAVMEYGDAILNLDTMTREDIIDTFFNRLGQVRAVSASRAGKGGRKEARDRAKEEREVYVVLFQLEEERASSGQATIGRVDSRSVIIKTYVYAPQTADLKYTDVTFQRPYRDTTTVGGVRIPVPSRRVEQYPSQLQLEQAAREAADRLMLHFGVTPPRDN